MTSPYTAPSAELPAEARPRIRHSLVAAASGTFLTPALILGLAIAFGVRKPSDIPLEAMPWIRSMAFFLLGGIVAGVVAWPMQMLKWYWAVVLGPIVSLASLLVLALVLEHFGIRT